jgi:putative intracellular protease/amidase
MVPIAIAVYHILQEGIPLALHSNTQHLEKSIIPEVQKLISEIKKSSAKTKKTILIPLPDTDVDAGETALPWKIYKQFYGFDVKFSTENGKKAQVDLIPLDGTGLDSIMSVIFRIFPFMHETVIKDYTKEMEQDPSFINPIKWADLDMTKFDAVWIPGGHAQGMRHLLGSTVIQQKMSEFWELKKPVAAVCHGVILLARTIDKNTGKSVLFNRKTTSVSNYMERLAQLVTTWKMGNYYKTYDEMTEDEVKRAVFNAKTVKEANDQNMIKMLYDAGPMNFSKGSLEDPFKGFVVEDENYISGRLPADVPLLAHRLAYKLLSNN